MTDDEKRAHEYALTMLPIIYDKNYKDNPNADRGDAFEIYQENYTEFLDRLKYL